MHSAAATLLLALAPLAPADPATPSPPLTPEQLEELFRDVELPPGDPNPDFELQRPWVPPSPDPSAHNKRGTDFGPYLAFTVQLDPEKFVRRGFTVQLPDQRAVLYDLDLMTVAASWEGGFLDISQTHFEDSKGKLPGRPGGDPTFWAFDLPGWADANGSFADPRGDRTGPLPDAQVRYRGHFLHGFQVVLSYEVQGRAVLEMPSVIDGLLTRTFHIAAGDTPLSLAIRSIPEKELTSHEEDLGDRGSLIIIKERQSSTPAAVLGAPKSFQWEFVDGILALHIPSSDEPINFTLFTADRIAPAEVRSRVERASDPIDLRNLVRGGSRRWTEPVVTQGSLGSNNSPYTVDTLTLPVDNPWKSWLRVAALDCLSDGRVIACMLNGDVWIVSGIDDSLKQLHWTRFATGLYEPLGLKIVEDRIYVLGRDRITRLHDLNLDGEADYYESFFDGGSVAPGYHAFCFDLQTDSHGNFYFVKSGRKSDDTPGHNSLIRVRPDGSSGEVIATGFRHPNGMGIGPDDEIVVSDNQGEYIPASKISLIREGGFYGYRVTEEDKAPFERPLLWLPMNQDNSSGGQVWAGSDWGPLSEMMLHTSYGSSKLFYVMVQSEGEERIHAAAVPLNELSFRSGIMRGRVNPHDGQLYVSGLKGWGTNAKDDGCLERVRYTGNRTAMLTEIRLLADSFELTFSEPLNADSARARKRYQIEQWNYIYSEMYGSPEMSVRKPEQKGHDELEIQQVTISDDGTRVRLRVPDVTPVDQVRIAFDLDDAAGHSVKQEAYLTVHRVPK